MEKNLNEPEESALAPLMRNLRVPVVLLETRLPLDPLLIDQIRETLSTAAGREISIDVKVNARLDVGARLIFGREKKLDLDLRQRLLGDLESEFAAAKQAGLTTVDETAAHLAKIIEKTEPRLRVEEAICARTANGGAEITKLVGTSAWYAPGLASAEMVEAILKDKKKIVPCSVYLQGEYGVRDQFFGVPIKLGAKGMEQVIEITLTAEEQAALNKSAAAVKELKAVINV